MQRQATVSVVVLPPRKFAIAAEAFVAVIQRSPRFLGVLRPLFAPLGS